MKAFLVSLKYLKQNVYDSLINFLRICHPFELFLVHKSIPVHVEYFESCVCEVVPLLVTLGRNVGKLLQEVRIAALQMLDKVRLGHLCKY